MKKKISSWLLLLLLLLPVCFAIGDGNLEGGGGDLGSGDGASYWNPGRDGVRVSIMDGNHAVVTFDISNQSWEDWVDVSFNKKNKLQYQSGTQLSPSNGYTNILLPPDLKMPRIISDQSGMVDETIAAVKRYFTDEATVRYLAEKANMSYEDLISGTYKLMIEPIAYFTFRDIRYGMTATETALFDLLVAKGDLKYRLGKLTHRNQPFSMFLEKSEFGISAWSGTSYNNKQSAATIIDYLGVGAVTFVDVPDIPISEQTYTFRTDKDVIVAVNIQNTGADITPDDNAYLDLDIGEKTYRRQFVCPAGESQLVWVKWHTPDTPQVVDISVTCDNIPRLNKQLTANIEELIENTPPDPKYEDSNPSFELADTPDYGSVTSNTWGEWYSFWVHDPTSHSEKDWVNTSHKSSCSDNCSKNHGYWDRWSWTCTSSDCDEPDEHGHWEFEYTTYQAGLNVEFSIEPDEQVPTAYQSGGQWVMASGYGVNVNAEVSVTTRGGADNYDVTPVQSIITTYPEFGFETYNRFMETKYSTHSLYSNIDWTLQENPYSYYSNRVHFTPLWYPDDANYVVNAVVFDAWTPGGMLYTTVEDEMLIFLSVLDDWYIRVEE